MKRVEFGFCGFENFEEYRAWFHDAFRHNIDNGIYFNDDGLDAIGRLNEIVCDTWSTIGSILDVSYNYHWNAKFVGAITKRIYGDDLEGAKEKMDAAIQLLSEIMDYKRPE